MNNIFNILSHQYLRYLIEIGDPKFVAVNWLWSNHYIFFKYCFWPNVILVKQYNCGNVIFSQTLGEQAKSS